MVKIDTTKQRYTILFKRKDLRPNKTDDKLELFRHIIGLEDTSDILDLNHYTGHHMSTEIRKEKTTITDINSFEAPFITARLTHEQYIRLKKDPNIEEITFKEVYYPPPMAQFIGWNHEYLKVQEAHDKLTYNIRGEGVNVGFCDTGTDLKHPDLTPNIKIRQNFTDDGGGVGPTPEPDGLANHGQKAMGMIGMLDNTIGSVGYASSCNIWSLRIYKYIEAVGFSSWDDADQLEAMHYAYSNNVHVLGCNVQGGLASGTIRMLETETRPAFDTKNILTTSAAGNQNRFTDPGDGVSGAYGVYGVSALNMSKKKASYSNYGPGVDFTNPAGEFGPVDVIQVTTSVNGGYGTFNGTSAACPGMTGCCAIAVAAYKPNSCSPYDPAVSKANTLTTALQMACVQPEGLPRLQHNDKYGYGYPELDRLCAILRGEVKT